MEQSEKRAKYCIVASFFKEPMEIEAIDLVASHNSLTNETFINFIGIDGRYYKLKETYVGMVIINEPNETELADFARLKREADTKEKPTLEKVDRSLYG